VPEEIKETGRYQRIDGWKMWRDGK